MGVITTARVRFFSLQMELKKHANDEPCALELVPRSSWIFGTLDLCLLLFLGEPIAESCPQLKADQLLPTFMRGVTCFVIETGAVLASMFGGFFLAPSVSLSHRPLLKNTQTEGTNNRRCWMYRNVFLGLETKLSVGFPGWTHSFPCAFCRSCCVRKCEIK